MVLVYDFGDGFEYDIDYSDLSDAASIILDGKTKEELMFILEDIDMEVDHDKLLTMTKEQVRDLLDEHDADEYYDHIEDEVYSHFENDAYGIYMYD